MSAEATPSLIPDAQEDPKPDPVEEPKFAPSLYFDDGDIILQSRDNVIYKLHKKNLEIACGVFENMFSTATLNDPIEMDDESCDLTRMLKFCYPSIGDPFDGEEEPKVILSVGRMAHKYEVHSGIRVVLQYLKFIIKHAMLDFEGKEASGDGSEVVTEDNHAQIFGYAVDCNHKELANSCVPLLLTCGVSTVAPAGMSSTSWALIVHLNNRRRLWIMNLLKIWVNSYPNSACCCGTLSRAWLKDFSKQAWDWKYRMRFLISACKCPTCNKSPLANAATWNAGTLPFDVYEKD